MIMQKIYFVRRQFRFDGGAEVASSLYLDVLNEIAPTAIVCEDWQSNSAIDVVKIARKGITRTQKYLGFISAAGQFLQLHPGVVHSHELLPGATTIRLGDGLHSSWVKLGNVRTGVFSDSFHKEKVRLENLALTNTALKYVIVNSRMVEEEVRMSYGDVETVLIRNIVQERFEIKPQKRNHLNKRLLFVGSGWDRKGLTRAIAALVHLPSFVLDVFGRDRYQAKFERYARSLGVADRVVFRGSMPMQPSLYDGYTALIHPAIYEPFPNVAVEALSQGIPVISTFNSGTSDFSSEEGVWTLPNDSPLEIRNTVEDILSQPISKRSVFRDHIMQFDKAYLRNQLLDLYSNLF